MFLLFAFVFIIVVISSACLKLNENLSTLVTNLFLSINFCSLYCYLLTESALYIGSCISYMFTAASFIFLCNCAILSKLPLFWSIDLFGWNIMRISIYRWETMCKYNNKKLYVTQMVTEIFVIYSRNKFRCMRANLIS